MTFPKKKTTYPSKTAVLDSFDQPMTGTPDVRSWEDESGVPPQHSVQIGGATVEYMVYPYRSMMTDTKAYEEREFGPVQGPLFFPDNGKQPILYVEMIGNGGS